MTSAIVLLSGGQDSTTILGVALKECERVTTISFDYGQKHMVELAAARAIANKNHVPNIVINLKPILDNMQSSALITHGDTSQRHPILKHLPASFVPARNALFLTVAYGLAIERSNDLIYGGMCQTDYSGYPDCRQIFVDKLNDALDTGYESGIRIITPLMYLTKAQTFKLAKDVGILDDVLKISVTCYEGDRSHWHDWGYGCGECPACKLREKGWNEYLDL